MTQHGVAMVLEQFAAAQARWAWRFPAGSVAWGAPGRDALTWIPLPSFAEREVIAWAVARWARARRDLGPVLGHWVFQNTVTTPLLMTGYLYLAGRRVPVLGENVLLRPAEYQQDIRLAAPRLLVLPDDPLPLAPGIERVADRAELARRLIGEVERTYRPIIAAFQQHCRLGEPNAWASVLDGLQAGMLLAGRDGAAMDAAWHAWDDLLAAWPVRTRRRPRRVQFAFRGQPEELVVQAACCLVFTTSLPDGSAVPYCAGCPVNIGDEQRVRRTVDFLDWARRAGVLP